MVRLVLALVLALIAAPMISLVSFADGPSTQAAPGTGVKLYAVGATSTTFSRLSLEEGSGLRRDFIIPKNGKPVELKISDVTADYDGALPTRMAISIGTTGPFVGDKVIGSVDYDFTGDGIDDAYVEFPEMEIAPVFAPQLYPPTPELAKKDNRLISLRNGTITLRVWNTGGVSDLVLRTDARSFEEQQSVIVVPYGQFTFGVPKIELVSPNPVSPIGKLTLEGRNFYPQDAKPGQMGVYYIPQNSQVAIKMADTNSVYYWEDNSIMVNLAGKQLAARQIQVFVKVNDRESNKVVVVISPLRLYLVSAPFARPR